MIEEKIPRNRVGPDVDKDKDGRDDKMSQRKPNNPGERDRSKREKEHPDSPTGDRVAKHRPQG